jgi:membrane protease YdiL (CAAX protease family)
MRNSLVSTWRASPTLVRVVPFVVFVMITAGQGMFGESSRYWGYLAKTVVGAALLFVVWPSIAEMRWRLSGSAILAGVGVFVLWVGLDSLYPSLDSLLRTVLCPVARPLGFEEWCSTPATQPAPWNPPAQFAGPLAWFFVFVRLAGSTLVVPPLEEVFYRSFLYRYIIKPEFQNVPFRCFQWVAFLMTAAIFGFAHYEWLPGILCAMIYQGLVLRKDRLGDAMTAHAITNFLLGLWIVWRGAWHFW